MTFPRACLAGVSLLFGTTIPTSAAPQFRPALPGYEFSFPRDHNAHPQFATEWWYYTGHLRAQDGRRFGYQLTWFRTALTPKVNRASKWAARDVMFAHFALTDERGQRFYFSDRIGRAGAGGNGATSASQSPRIWCGSWQLQFGGKRGETQQVQALARSDASSTKGQTFSLRLFQRALKAPVAHGIRGVSQKSAGVGRASHYYSFTRLQTRGVLRIGNETLQVEGQSWFDHEFGSAQLAPNQVGWDWFSLQLSDGRELMLYRLRLKNGGVEPFSSGTLIDERGRARHLKLRDFSMRPLETWKSSSTKGSYPSRWQLEVPSAQLKLQVTPVLADQELRPRRSGTNLAYWEGLVEARGTAENRAIQAQGYLEMTGYASAFGSTF